MKIKHLKLHNFKSYGEKTTFDFNTTKEKNIILIGGKNGAGKSSLFESIRLCLFGSLAYGYYASNTHYVKKIRANINDSALLKSPVHVLLELEIELEEGNDQNTYTLIREWYPNKKSINESFSVNQNNVCLSENEIEIFTKNLYSIISPTLMNYIFFDGEKVSDFFININNNNLKDMVSNLNNLDTFYFLKEIMISNALTKKDIDSDVDSLQHNYLKSEFNLTSAKDKLNKLVDKKTSLEDALNLLISEKTEIEKDFIVKGGLRAIERESLQQNYATLENERNSLNQKLKDLCNDTLPFIILKDELTELKKQIDFENEFSFYNDFCENITFNEFEQLSENLIDKSNCQSLYAEIEKFIFPKVTTHRKVIHNYAKATNIELTHITQKFLKTDTQSISNIFTRITTITSMLEKLRKQLEFTNSEIELKELIDQLTEKNEKIQLTTSDIVLISEHIISDEENIETLLKSAQKNKELYYEYLKINKIEDLTTDIITFFDKFLDNCMFDLKDKITKNFMMIMNAIYRKENFIDHIEIDNNFNVLLYKFDALSTEALKNLNANLELDDNTKNMSNYYKAFELDGSKIYGKRLDVNKLSSGEKQLYVMCIYWSIIKSSLTKFPFIIDTPMARIDETHKMNIAQNFLNTISDQVIVLSTDSEVDENIYSAIKKSIANEYSIEYNTSNSTTNLTNTYFCQKED